MNINKHLFDLNYFFLLYDVTIYQTKKKGLWVWSMCKCTATHFLTRIKKWYMSSHTSPAVVTILDWDNTVIPSEYLQNNAYPKHLKELETSAFNILNWALQCSQQCFVVTNAGTGWVELCVNTWFPKLTSILKQFTVISARSTYEHHYGYNPLRWKIEAMKDVMHQVRIEKNQEMHLVNIGDSEYDHTAFDEAVHLLKGCHTKKIRVSPLIDPIAFVQQHKVLQEIWKALMNCKGHHSCHLNQTVYVKDDFSSSSDEEVEMVQEETMLNPKRTHMMLGKVEPLAKKSKKVGRFLVE